MVEELVSIRRLEEVVRKLEALGQLKAKIHQLLTTQVKLFDVDLGSVPDLDVVLNLERPVPAGLLHRITEIRSGVKVRGMVLERLHIQQQFGQELRISADVAADCGDERQKWTYCVEIPRKGKVTAWLRDLLFLSLLEESDWDKILAVLEEKETEWKDVSEKLAAALAALKVVLS